MRGAWFQLMHLERVTVYSQLRELIQILSGEDRIDSQFHFWQQAVFKIIVIIEIYIYQLATTRLLQAYRILSHFVSIHQKSKD